VGNTAPRCGVGALCRNLQTPRATSPNQLMERQRDGKLRDRGVQPIA
jgi:hypothetical protein